MRIAEWRASGVTAQEFCAGREFTAGSLYFWSSKLGRRTVSTEPQRIQLARVVRRKSASLVPTQDSGDVPLVLVEIAGVRVFVAPGVNRATVESVLLAVNSAIGGHR